MKLRRDTVYRLIHAARERDTSASRSYRSPEGDHAEAESEALIWAVSVILAPDDRKAADAIQDFLTESIHVDGYDLDVVTDHVIFLGGHS